MSSSKQLLFLQELEEVLELTKSEHFDVVVIPLFKRLSRCIESRHCQVAERTLMLWSNQPVFTLMTDFRYKVLPLVYGVLKKNSDSHWNSTVQSLSDNILNFFRVVDEAFFTEVSSASPAEVDLAESERRQREVKWEKLATDFENKGFEQSTSLKDCY